MKVLKRTTIIEHQYVVSTEMLEIIAINNQKAFQITNDILFNNKEMTLQKIFHIKKQKFCHRI